MKISGMDQDTELLAIHATALLTWAVRQFGRALLVATIVGGFAASAVGGWGLLVGTLVFAIYLSWVAAPMPGLVDDES